MLYRKTLIEKNPNNGMYSAFILGHGFLKADTLEGIKELIRGVK